MSTYYYLIGHIAEDIIHISITYNTEEAEQKYRLGTLKPLFAGPYQRDQRGHDVSHNFFLTVNTSFDLR